MRGGFLRHRGTEGEAFDMTPVIDVVFLLIIFFMLVCQFMAAERFRVEVPEQIGSAAALSSDERILTLAVGVDEEGGAFYASGNERLGIENPDDITAVFSAAIDEYFRVGGVAGAKTVRLRCDKSVTFGQVRPVLEGIAQSSATDVDWAVRE